MAAQQCTKCGNSLKPGANFCTRCGTPVSRGAPEGKRSTGGKRQTSWVIPAAIIGGALVLIIVLLQVLSVGNPSQTADLPLGEQSNIPYPTVERITAEDAYPLVQSGEALLVDVRTAGAFTDGHAAGALSLPEGELSARLNELPRDQLIITYCT